MHIACTRFECLLCILLGIIIEAQSTSVQRNLVTLMIYPGTYLDRYEDENRDWEAAIEIQNSLLTTLKDNAVAGSEKLGYVLLIHHNN